MYIVGPLTKCVSYEKRERQLSLLAPIAKTTIQNEHECLAYAWFKSDTENEVPDRYIKGLEVYQNEVALSQTHRSSPEYKEMKAARIPEGIVEEPTDLRPLQPAGIGFLNKSSQTEDFSNSNTRDQVIIARHFSPTNDDSRTSLKDILTTIDAKILDDSTLANIVKSFWVLEYYPDVGDKTLVTFERYSSKKACLEAQASLHVKLSKLAPCCSHIETTRWINAGIGFIRGNVQ